MSTPAGDAKRARRDDARAKAARLQADAAAAERRRRALWVGLAVLLVAVLAVGITFAVRAGKKDETSAAANFGDKGAIAVPAPDGSKAPASNVVTVRTYFDFMCPACKSFEAATDAWQQEQVKAGKIKREFVPVAILDRFSSGTMFSTRASNAAFCVATADASKIHDFTAGMYTSQPPENSTGLTDEQLLGIAKKSIPNSSTMDACITDGQYKGYSTKITDQASKDGLSGTPTVWINGKSLKFNENQPPLVQLQKAVADAAAAGAK